MGYNVPQANLSELTVGTDTSVKRFSIADVKTMIDTHTPSQVPSSEVVTVKAHVTSQMSAGGYDNAG